ncbi:type I-E CRISPR-associated protein Cas6/Cse3/CasE [Rhodococcus sp. WAY2]|uniref:type I-E CRISPR-associated protein Cas6/Cse3/CasE n=1 Tax=Rhodococcus sp. WAY2 TaxID=2663121 RepID=UPI0013201DA3|nr:type I-E CRISPR-associated protein Cas6/Cse3/CasE [Rhodococcus sp. WAY2]QHE72597.1 CRISPR-associated protein, Cse3 family [Rhodococcus sp. WAY2]
MTTATRTLHQSLLVLDANHGAVRAAIGDAHHMHALVMSGFADRLQQYDFFTGQTTGHADHRAALNIQHAVSLRPDNTIRVLVRSAVPPHWDTDASGKWVDALTTAPASHEYIPLLEGAVRYELRANPIRKGPDGRRKIALRQHDDLVNWWHRRATNAGLTLTGTPSIDLPWTLTSRTKTDRTTQHKAGAGFTIGTHRFTGFAIITNPDAHLAALTEGIGSARAYGCGLLLTMRPPR